MARLTSVSWMGLLFPVRGESKLLIACIASEEREEKGGGERREGRGGFITPLWAAACRSDESRAYRVTR